MRIVFLLVWLPLTGCNLFTGVEEQSRVDSGSADLGQKPVLDMAPANDVRPAADARPADVGTRPDLGAPDLGAPDNGVCVPETDAELCASIGANCGVPPGSGAQRWDFEAEDYPVDGCGVQSGFVVLCDEAAAVSTSVDVTADGDYVVEAVVMAELISDVPALAELTVDGTIVAEIPVTDDQMPSSLAVVTALTAGTHSIGWGFANDAYIPPSRDRNLLIDTFAVAGPLGGLLDRCGTVRTVDCGSCPANETCGLLRANVCGCPCPLSDGSCAAEGDDNSDACVECGPTGWVGVSGSCSDQNSCTNDSCNADAGVCVSTPMFCPPVPCQIGTCSGGSCQYAPRMDGSFCGFGGVCTGGACGCADGTTTEVSCTDAKDNDCDGLINCADPDCDGLSCQAGNTCSMGLCQ